MVNVPVGCSFCGQGTAYGRISQQKTYKEIITECSWICSNCGQVAKRHTESEPLPQINEEKKDN